MMFRRCLESLGVVVMGGEGDDGRIVALMRIKIIHVTMGISEFVLIMWNG